MGTTTILKNILDRKPMVAYSEQYSIQPQHFEVELKDFELNPIIKCLYKADNQRSTEYWCLDEIIEFIWECLSNPNTWLTVLYWKDEHGNIYIIDGGHRISLLLAWSLRYFADEQVDDSPHFNEQQKKDIRYVRTRLGEFCDFQKLFTDPQFEPQKQNLDKLNIKFNQVIGSPEDARKAFESINSKSKRLDRWEEAHLRNRGHDLFYVIYACCYIDDNKANLIDLGEQYLNHIIILGEKIHKLLFSTILLDTDLAHGKRIGLVTELLNILTNDLADVVDDPEGQGQRVYEQLVGLYTILSRITKPEADNSNVSLGLHPQLYFFKEGRFQITSFLAWFAIIAELHQTKKLQSFACVRKNVELLIVNFPIATTETVGKFGSGVKGHDRLQIVYKAFIKISSLLAIDLEDEQSLNTVVLALSKSFDYLNFNDFLEGGFMGVRDNQVIQQLVDYVLQIKPQERPKSQKFSTTTKTILKQVFQIHNQNFCLICDGLLYSPATEVDHRIARALGGQATIENAALLHPYCNRFKSDRTEEEARAALLGA